jgi:hypothetical protein
MLWLLRATLKEAVEMKYFKAGAIDLCTWIIGMKIVKVMPHFKKNQRISYICLLTLAMGIWPTLAKVWALLTCWNASWATAKISEKVSDKDATSLCQNSDTDGKPTFTALD